MFVGMDVHRNRTQVCVMDNKGNEVRNRNVVNDRRLLATELSGLKKGTPVAFEAAYGTGWVAQLLSELGLEAHLAHPSGCRAMADANEIGPGGRPHGVDVGEHSFAISDRRRR